MSKKSISQLTICVVLGAAVLSACDGLEVEEAEPYVTEQRDRIRQQSGTFHGNDKGIVIYSDKDKAGERGGEGPAVNGQGSAESASGVANPYLWQASLESLDFMPLAQADSRGGVIISDWYAPPETPDERFKVTVYIRDQALRADALKVAVFRQTKGKGGWVDAEVDKNTASGLEDNILKRARELRLAGGNTG
ncbi:MAG: DUF3576 domain-containing protein [Alphaproteobacteria bacterium]|nr:DUF3576 domain-containing protein [Alphaproteobacteria bacterium]